jgi:hypothetical protein
MRRTHGSGGIVVAFAVMAWSRLAAAQVPLPPEHNWETFLMPGAQYSLYLPSASGTYGHFQGFSIEILIAAWIHQNENRGPSHGRIYFDIDLLSSPQSTGKVLTYTLGVDLSFERDARRDFAIPFYGVEMGGLYLVTVGNITTINPFAGLHVVAKRNVFINVTGGYLFPISHVDELKGWRVKAGLDFSFW